MCGAPANVEPLDFMLCDETLTYIREHLPEELIEPFDDMIGNNKIRSPLVDTIRQNIAEILTEREDDVGD